MAQQQNQGSTTGRGTSNRGFASMDPALQRAIASQGGRAAHQKGTAHEFDSREAAEAGRKGGEAVSRDRQHMAQIGAEGGRSRGAHKAAAAAAAANNASVSSSTPSRDPSTDADRQNHKDS